MSKELLAKLKLKGEMCKRQKLGEVTQDEYQGTV